MRRWVLESVFVCVAVALVGAAAPLTTEEVQVGGGYGDAGNAVMPAGGTTLDDEGNVSADGDGQFDGDLNSDGALSQGGVGVATTGTAILKTLFDAQTLLRAIADDTPVALTVGEQTLVGRITAGDIAALTPAQVRTLLALVIGTNVQAWDATLDDIADGTIAEDLVNTAHPWANNEVSDTLSIGSASTVHPDALPNTVTYTDKAETLTANWVNTANPWAIDEGGTGAATASAARTALGLAIGSDVQAYDGDTAKTDVAETITANWVNTANPWADNEVSDTLTSSLFVGSGSTTNAVDLATAEAAGTLPIANGGTGATTASAARTALGVAIGSDVQAYDGMVDDIADLTDPGVDTLIVWDDSEGILGWIAIGTGLTVSGGGTPQLNATGASSSVDLPDDGFVLFGDADEIQNGYNGTSDYLEWKDKDGNQFGTLTDGGTTGTLDFDVLTEGGNGVLNTTDIGVSIQAYDADLADLADGTLTATKVQYGSLMIPNAGSDGQIWTSDGSGVGGWEAAPAGYTSWTIDADAGGTTAITDGATAVIAGGTGVTTTEGSGTVTITIDNEAYMPNSAGTDDQVWTSDGSGRGGWEAAASGYDKWVLTGDSGTQDIDDGNTVDIAGSTGISTAAAATDTLTITLDSTLADISDGTIAENLVNTANPWAVNEGGTGAATFTDGGPLLGSGTSAVTAMAVGTAGQVIVGDGTTDPNWVTWKAPIMLSAGGSIPTYSNGAAAAVLISDDVMVVDFDKDTDESCIWNFAMPSDFDSGNATLTTTIYFTFEDTAYWEDSADKVNFEIAGASRTNSDDLTPSYGTAVEINRVWASGEAFGDIMTATGSALTIGGSPDGGHWITIKLTKDADDATNDTADGDCRILGILLEYTRDDG